MKKNSKYLFVAILAGVLAMVWLATLPKRDRSNYAIVSKKLEDIKTIERIEVAAGTKFSGDLSLAKQGYEEGLQIEFKKCFNKDASAQSLDAMKNLLLQQKEYSSPSMTQESFDLITADRKNLIVQHIPMEENSNQVRVFELNSADGLPDRVKDFPQHSAETSLRLQGALSLGTVQTKTVSTTQSAYDGSLLNFDETNGKVVRVHLITTGFDFECKEQSCLCLKKE